MEQKTWWKGITYAPRMDYLAFQNNEFAFVAAVEKLLELEVPPKATWMRTLLFELNRIHSHLSGSAPARWRSARSRCSGTASASATGPRPLRAGRRRRACTRGTSRPAGSPRTSRRGFFPECRGSPSGCRSAIDDVRDAARRNKIWLERTRGLGLLSADDAIALGQSGPVLRGSGVDWDLRRDEPYLAYAELDFDVPVYHEGDVYDRYRVHMDEMRESTQIIAQCLDGSSRCTASRGSPTTARSCCRRARSSTPRWSR